METLLSLGLGGLLRLAPEVLNFFDRKNRRKHEVELADKAAVKSEIEATGNAVVSQMTVTGIKFVDMMNFAVRPVLTYYWCLFLYTAYLVASYIEITESGTNTVDAILQLFGDNEKSIVNSIITFWFMDRVLRYNKRGI